ncbi:MAG TPA: hypothetical protein PLP56_07040 [Candidatus Omnitrophota bacterium]|nr:hypothetical protein [Candidatus Omnitrophota bacterium]HQO37667.1 hypothetical protein [Candidatus Omnitrophota bacterium]HQQ06714.1 hypothetical protein [Candidatus Omnitrophota bacterium]
MDEKNVKRPLRAFLKPAVIGSVLLFGLFLRLPQLDFPSIGYHNMKENEYISMAKHMLKTGNLVDRQVYFYNAFEQKKDFNLYPQIPFVSYQILAGYRLFGDHLWFPRLVNIFLMLGAFLLLYRIAGLLNLAAWPRFAVLFLLAVMPLGVFFARNLQAESGAFFFMCAGNALGLHFIRSNKRGYLAVFSLALAVTAAYKLAFLIGFLPVIALMPFKEYARRRGIKSIAADLMIIAVPITGFALYCILTGQTTFSEAGDRVRLLRVFTPLYWRTSGPVIRHYLLNENFTVVYSVLSAAGLLLAWLSLRADQSIFARYLRAWSLCLIPYMMVFSDYINQHNYYQMPFLGLAVFAVVYALERVSAWTSAFLKTGPNPRIFVILFIAAFLAAVPAMRIAVAGHFRMIYPGADTAGLYLKQKMEPDEKFFIYSTCQGYAPCVYAQRRCGWPVGLEEFKRIEAEEQIRYAVIYPFGYINTMPAEMKEYLLRSYRVESLGFLSDGKNIVPQSVVLRKGGVVDIDGFVKKNLLHAQRVTVYRTAQGSIPFYEITDAEAGR